MLSEERMVIKVRKKEAYKMGQVHKLILEHGKSERAEARRGPQSGGSRRILYGSRRQRNRLSLLRLGAVRSSPQATRRTTPRGR